MCALRTHRNIELNSACIVFVPHACKEQYISRLLSNIDLQVHGIVAALLADRDVVKIALMKASQC